MDTYDQATQQSIQNFNKMQSAIKSPEPTQGLLGTYLSRGFELPKVSEQGKLGFLGTGINFLGGVAQDFLNIPSNIIGGVQQISRGDTYGGLGRLGQGALDLGTTLLTGGLGKAGVKGAQKLVLGGALKGIEGQAIETAGKKIIGKEVLKSAGIGAGVGAGYGLTGALKDLDQIPLNQQTDYIMNNILTGGTIGGLTGGLFKYKAINDAVKNFSKIETNVLKNIATKNYEDLISTPLDKQGRFIVDIVDEDIKKASLEAIAGAPKGIGRIDKILKPVRQLGGGMQDAFQNWVNTRNSTGILSLLKYKEFRPYVDKGVKGILDFEKDASKFPGLKEYFDGMYKTLTKAGILKEGQYFDEVNYLPLLFDNTKEEVAAAFEKKRRLSLKPSFAFERVLSGYNEGVALGLTPKFNNVAELAQWYEKTARKAIADKNFFNTLIKNSWVVPSKKSPKEWVELDSGFPRFQSRTRDGFITDRYSAPPELAQVINNYLALGQDGTLAAIGRFYDGVKQRILAAGIPFTGFNTHGFSTFIRYSFGSGKNSFIAVPQALYMMSNPNYARKIIQKNMDILPEATQAGLVISEKSLKNILYSKQDLKKEFEKEFAGKGFFRRNLEKTWKMYEQAVEDPLMESIIPAYKIEVWKNTYNTFKTYMPDNVARKKAADFANTLLGGLNYDEMGRSQEVKNLMKFFLLAPDWFETNLTLGARTAKSLWDKDKNFRAYRTFLTGIMGSYILSNAINKGLSGKYMWENEPGQKFSIDTGTYDEQGNKRYIQIYGTGIDFLRLPVDVIDGIVNEDYGVLSRIARNRLSPLASTLVSLYSNTDYAGRPLFGTDKFGNPLTPEQNIFGLTSIAGQALGVPTVFGEIARNVSERIVTGESPVPLEKSIAIALDLPIRYKAEVSDITKMQRERTKTRKEFETALINNDTSTARMLSKQFTDREISTIISNIKEKNVNKDLTTREKLFNRLSEQQQLELAKTSPEFNSMLRRITALKEKQDNDPINRFKDTLTGKEVIKAPKAKKPRKFRARKVRAKKPTIKKVKQLKIKKLSTLKA